MQSALSKEERSKLTLQHKKGRDKRVCDRIKAVLLEGWSYEKIAHVLLLSEEAVCQHVNDYQTSQKLKKEIGHARNPNSSFMLGIQATFKIGYTNAGMISWLEKNEFSYKKPALVPGKANREAQEQWIKGS